MKIRVLVLKAVQRHVRNLLIQAGFDAVYVVYFINAIKRQIRTQLKKLLVCLFIIFYKIISCAPAD